MKRTPLIERLTGLIGSGLSPLGVELWGVELASAGSRMVVRVYIDAQADESAGSPAGEPVGEPVADMAVQGGVTIAACARVSRHLGAPLDAEDAVPGAYVLEVSSPGLERRFFVPEQLSGYLGRTIDVRLNEATDGRRHLRGLLSEVKGQAGAEELVVDEDGVRTSVLWAQVKTAHLVHEFPGAAA